MKICKSQKKKKKENQKKIKLKILKLSDIILSIDYYCLFERHTIF